MDFEPIINIDRSLLEFFISGGNPLVDAIASNLTCGWTWMALYIALFVIVIKNNETMGQILLFVVMAALCVLLSDGITDGIVKPLAMRLRPCNDPVTVSMLHVVKYIPTNTFSFFSAHAANTVAFAVFASLVLRSGLLSFVMAVWAAVNCWTRLYLAMHYPSDIVVGVLVGMVIGTVVYLIYKSLYSKISSNTHYISSQYTSTGYALPDIYMFTLVVLMTIIASFLIAFLFM